MAVTERSAPGKIILFGEHAVVYGQPAIAVPVTQIRTTASVEDGISPGVWLHAPDIDQHIQLEDSDSHDPFARSVNVFCENSGLRELPPLSITVSSTIPIAGGLGSGAAMAAAVIRALAAHFGFDDLAQDDQVSKMTYIVEQLLHGTPSGIDNTVIAFERPVFFIRRQPTNLIDMLAVKGIFRFIAADSGVSASTKEVVADVRHCWEQDKDRFQALFDACGSIAIAAKEALEEGNIQKLGHLMRENQALLEEMTVSSEQLERLIRAAEKAGALGAKLSGAGRGGNIIALLSQGDGFGGEKAVSRALIEAGAAKLFSSTVGQD